MSRSTSTVFRQAVYRQETGEVLAVLITFTHANLTAPIRISTDNRDTFELEGLTVRGTISRGNNFVYTPIEISLPDDKEGSISQATLSIENISREILREVRGMAESPSVLIEVVVASQPDTVEAVFTGFELIDVTATPMVISGTLSSGSFLSEPYPGGSILPSNFPGAF